MEELQKKSQQHFLDVGLVIFLQPKGVHKNIRYKSTVVGWKPDKVIMIDMPILNGAYINLACGCTCIVRYIYGGNAYGFETKVIKNINDPNLPLVCLTYPQDIAKISLREHKRIQTFIPLYFEVKVGKQVRELEGTILDLSAGGCLFEVDNKNDVDLTIESKIQISFTLPNYEEQLTKLQSIIKRIQTAYDNTKVGVQFIDISPETLARIRDFCDSISN